MPSSSGVSVYALEGLVWSALTLAWVSSRLALSPSAADQAVLCFAIALSVCNVVACSVSPSSDQPQSAYFVVLFSLWITYAYLVVEAMSLSGTPQGAALEKALFGGLFMPLVAAAMSTALLTVQTLIAAAALRERLWVNSNWADVSVVFVTTVQTCLCRQSDVGTAIFAMVFVLNFFVLLLALPRLFLPADMSLPLGIPLSSAAEYVNVTLACVSGALALGVAASKGTTLWALPVLLVLLLASLALRAAGWQSQSQAQQADAGQSEGAPSGTPAVRFVGKKSL